MQIFRSQQSKNRPKPRLSWINSNKKQKRRVVIFAVVFGLLGGYIVFRSFAATTLTGAEGEFTAVSPARILNTTNGVGGRSTSLGPGETLKLKVAGVGGVPASNVRAVSLNIAVAAPSAWGYLTVWQSGIPQPATSTLNFTAGKYMSNHVISQVSSDGYIQINNSAGNTHIVVDVMGYYATSGSSVRGGRYNALTPAIIANSVTGLGGLAGPVQSGQTVTLQVTGKGGVPTSGVTAVSLNVLAISKNYNGWMTVWPAGATRPSTSNVNYTSLQATNNLVTVKVGTNGQVSFYNSGSNADLYVDVQGYYGATSSSNNQVGRFVPVKPSRAFNSANLGRFINNDESIAVQLAGKYGIPTNDVYAVVLNVAVAPSNDQQGYGTVWSLGESRPNISNLRYGNRDIVANQVIVKTKPGGSVGLYNAGPPSQYIVDVVGFYANDVVSSPKRFPGDPNPKVSGKAYWGAAYESNGDVKTRYENAAGKSLSIRRTYWAWDKAATDMVTTAKADIAANRLPYVSTKTPAWAAMGSGQYDAAIDTMLKNLDAAGGPVWLTLWHEPEDNATGTAPNEKCERDPVKYGVCAGTPADWRAMQSRVKSRMTALGIKNVALMPTLMSWTFDSASGRNPEDWWVPGIWNAYMVDHYCDQLTCIDKGQVIQNLSAWTKFVAWAEAKGMPYGLGEWGSRGTDTAAAQRMQSYWDWSFISGRDMIAYSYFDSSLNSDTGAWTLTGEPYNKFIDILKNDNRVSRIK